MDQEMHPLAERGYNYLRTGIFSSALTFFEQALNENARLSRAYWGLLLAKRRCATEEDLVREGAGIRMEPDFRFACQYADPEEKALYEATAKCVQISCHRKVLILLEKGDLLTARLRAEAFRKDPDSHPEIARRQSELLKDGAFDGPNRATVEALEALKSVYEKDEYYAVFAEKSDLITRVTAMTESYLAKIQNQALQPGCAREKRAEYLAFWADPTEKGDPKAGGRFLEEAILARERSENLPDLLALARECLKKAESCGADPVACREEHQKQLALTMKGEFSKDEWDFVIRDYPDDWQPYWEKALATLKEGQASREWKEEPSAEFLQLPFEKYAKEDGAKEIAQREKALAEVSEFADRLTREASPAAEKAFSLAGEEAPRLRAEWEKKIRALREEGETKKREREENLAAVRAFCEKNDALLGKDKSAAAQKERKKGNVSAIVSAILLLLTAAGAFYAWLVYRDPAKMLEFNTLGYVLAATGICLAATVILFIVYAVLSGDKKTSGDRTKLARVATGFFGVLAPILCIGAAVLFILAGVGFNSAIGVIEIAKPEDLRYLDLHHGAEFALTQDLDMSGREWVAVEGFFTDFSGTFDGRGHRIAGVSPGEAYLFEVNGGTIKDLTLASPRLPAGDFSVVKKNEGVIENCAVIRVKGTGGSFSGFASENRGEIRFCRVEAAGPFENFCGVAGEQREGAVTRECTCDFEGTARNFAGIAQTGRIEDCTANLALEETDGQSEIAGIGGTSVVRCRATGFLHVLNACVGGIAARKEAVEAAACAAELEISLRVTQQGNGVLCAGGILAGAFRDCALTDCLFTGTLTLTGANEASHAAGIIGYASARASMTRCVSDHTAGEGSDKVSALVESADGAGVVRRNSLFRAGDQWGVVYSWGEGSDRSENLSFAQITSAAFLKETLSFSDTVWKMEDGKRPELKRAGAAVLTEEPETKETEETEHD